MKNKSEISYWCENENILTVPCVSPPVLGELIHINTLMDESWYEANFPNKKLFKKGVRHYYEVQEIRRSYSSFDFVSEHKLPNNTYNFPSQKIIETFEVQLKKI